MLRREKQTHLRSRLEIITFKNADDITKTENHQKDLPFYLFISAAAPPVGVPGNKSACAIRLKPQNINAAKYKMRGKIYVGGRCSKTGSCLNVVHTAND